MGIKGAPREEVEVLTIAWGLNITYDFKVIWSNRLGFKVGFTPKAFDQIRTVFCPRTAYALPVFTKGCSVSSFSSF